jgi:hypothetical protein
MKEVENGRSKEDDPTRIRVKKAEDLFLIQKQAGNGIVKQNVV